MCAYRDLQRAASPLSAYSSGPVADMKTEFKTVCSCVGGLRPCVTNRNSCTLKYGGQQSGHAVSKLRRPCFSLFSKALGETPLMVLSGSAAMYGLLNKTNLLRICFSSIGPMSMLRGWAADKLHE